MLTTASWTHKSSSTHESNFGQVRRILGARSRKQEKAQQELIGLVEDFAYDDKSEDEILMSDEFEEESSEIEAEEMVCTCAVTYSLT